MSYPWTRKTRQQEWHTRFIPRNDPHVKQKLGGVWIVYKNKRRGF